jgi:hypothetical protein
MSSSMPGREGANLSLEAGLAILLVGSVAGLYWVVIRYLQNLGDP